MKKNKGLKDLTEWQIERYIQDTEVLILTLTPKYRKLYNENFLDRLLPEIDSKMTLTDIEDLILRRCFVLLYAIEEIRDIYNITDDEEKVLKTRGNTNAIEYAALLAKDIDELIDLSKTCPKLYRLEEILSKANRKESNQR